MSEDNSPLVDLAGQLGFDNDEIEDLKERANEPAAPREPTPGSMERLMQGFGGRSGSR